MARRATRTSNSKSSTRRRAIQNGYRSGLEEAISASLSARGASFKYEPFLVPYVAKPKTYKPDFVLDNGIIVESKGYFTSADRTKHRQIKDQHPDLDLRFVFSRSSNTLGKNSTTTYAMWCEKYGFQYADKDIPDAWLKERPNKRRLAALKDFKKVKSAA